MVDMPFIRNMESSQKTGNLYTIKEVSQLIGVSPHTLRYWEKEFSDMLVPIRTPGQQRRYNHELLEILHEIFRLVKVEGYSIRGARRQLIRSRINKSAQQ